MLTSVLQLNLGRVAAGGPQVYERLVADGLEFYDPGARDRAHRQSDSLLMREALLRELGIALRDSPQLVDTLSHTQDVLARDTTLLLDRLTRDLAHRFLEGASLADTSRRDTARGLTDYPLLADRARRDTDRLLIDPVWFADTVATYKQTVNEIIRSVLDAVLFSDATTRDSAVQLRDPVLMSDLVRRELGKQLTPDAVLLADTSAVARTKLLALLDALLLRDGLAEREQTLVYRDYLYTLDRVEREVLAVFFDRVLLTDNATVLQIVLELFKALVYGLLRGISPLGLSRGYPVSLLGQRLAAADNPLGMQLGSARSQELRQ